MPIVPDAVDDSPPEDPRDFKEIALEAAMLLPNLIKLLYRMLRDPRVSYRKKAFIGAVLVYVVSPVDFVPDFVVGLGKIDDILLISVAIDNLMRGTDADVVLEHWDGSVDGLDLVRSVFAWGAEILPDSIRSVLPK